MPNEQEYNNRKDFLFEQYKALRAEVIQSIVLQTTIFQIGLTVNSIIFVASTNFSRSKEELITVNILLIPFMLLCFGILWASEYRRMRRAGSFIQKIEVEFLEPEMCWTLQKRGHNSEYTIITTQSTKMIIYTGVGASSIVFGYVRSPEISFLEGSFIIFVLISILYIGLYIVKKITDSE